MIQSGNKGPTSVEIGSRRASSITGDKSTAAAGRWRRRERAIFTPRMMEQLWETTPEPWWLITADTGWWVGGGGTQVHQQHPRPPPPLLLLLLLARFQHPRRRLVGKNLRDMTPPTPPPRNRSMEVPQMPLRKQPGSRRIVRLFSSSLARLSVCLSLLVGTEAFTLHHICLRGNILQQLMGD